MGVWIETTGYAVALKCTQVTPCMGVWIETCHVDAETLQYVVTPCMGVWIETFRHLLLGIGTRRHTLYGCVD